MTIKADIDSLITKFPLVMRIQVDCSPRGGKRIFGGNAYRGKHLDFVGKSRATKLREETEREKAFKEKQVDAFQSSASNEGPQA